MNRDEIIRMAREAGFEFNSLGGTYTSGKLDEYLERFAALIAAAEREACAKVCETERERLFEYGSGLQVITADKLANAIRARKEK